MLPSEYAAPMPPPRRSVAVPVLVGVIIALLAGFAVLAALASGSASDDAKRTEAQAAGQRAKARDLAGANDNRAVTDPALTGELTGQLRPILEQAFSYNYADLDSTAKASADGLTGAARCQYDALYGKVRQAAPQQKLVLTTKVREIGVTSLSGDRAAVLVFLDQHTSRGDTGQSNGAGAQLTLQAQRQGGRWRISAFDLLGQPLPNGQSTPSC